MGENEIQIIVRAVDDATKTLERIEGKIDRTNKDIAKSNEKLGESFQRNTDTLIALGNAAGTVDRIFSSYQNLQLRLENANLRVENSTDSLSDAQERLRRLQESGTATGYELADAQTQIDRSARSLEVAQNNLARANNAVWGTYINISLQSVVLVKSIGTMITANGGLAASFNMVTVSAKGLLFTLGPLIAAAGAVGFALSKIQDSDLMLAWDRLYDKILGTNLEEQELAYRAREANQIRTLETVPGINIEIEKVLALSESYNKLNKTMEKNSVIRGGSGKGIYDRSGVKLTSAQAVQIIQSRSRGIGVPSISAKDALVRPGKAPITFSNKDTILAMEDMSGLGGGIVITGNNIYGTDPEDIADAIMLKLRRKIST